VFMGAGFVHVGHVELLFVYLSGERLARG